MKIKRILLLLLLIVAIISFKNDPDSYRDRYSDNDDDLHKALHLDTEIKETKRTIAQQLMELKKNAYEIFTCQIE